jgi:hypothetical protein
VRVAGLLVLVSSPRSWSSEKLKRQGGIYPAPVIRR